MPLPTDLFPAHQLVTDPVERLTYETDAGPDRALPDGVVYVESSEDVARLAEWAARHEVPLVARGAGTGLAGGAVADRGGLVVVTTRMNRVLEVDVAGRLVVAEAGAVNLELDRRVGREGLYYPPDPASGRSSLVGGNLGTNAGGPHCFKYGVTTNYVAGLDAVLADGSAVRLGGRAADYPEYDLAGLVVGSEGTLAIVTRAILRLERRPPAVRTLMVAFESLEIAGRAVSAVIAGGLVPATLEAIDQPAMRMIEEFCSAGMPVESGAVLIVELDGYEAGLAEQAAAVERIMRREGATEVRVATSEEERARIWHGRKSAAGAMSRLAPSYYLTDITVRRSRLASVLARVNRICERHDLKTASFFHAGDGNLHPLIPCDERDAEMMARVERALDEIVGVCLEEDGSITGEHGVGIEKREQMARMHAGAELRAMAEVKEAFDPASLLNPGKVLPAEHAAVERAPARPPEGSTFAPGEAEEAAAGLRALAESGRATRIVGGGGSGSDNGKVRLSTAGLDRVIELGPDDLFVTVGAGLAANRLDEILQPHGLMAPIRSPWPDATLGGIVASNLNAPLRLRYGALRDTVLAARIAMTDGRIVRAGRPLVKNVAGYDLTKVFVGSHGTLGLLTEVTLKLVPAPRARRTLALPVANLGQGLERARAVLPGAIVASGVVLSPVVGDPSGGEGWLLSYTAEGATTEVDVELEEVEKTWRKHGGETCLEISRCATSAWADALGWAGDGDLVARAAVPVAVLSSYLDELPAPRYSRLFVDCAAGVVHASLPAPEAGAAADWLEELRRPALDLGGYAIAQHLPAGLEGALDPWGYRPSALQVMRRLKHLWDPAGILHRGFLGLKEGGDTNPLSES